MKKYLLFFLLQSITLFSFAQETTIKAFSESYVFENSQQYDKAITALENVYDANVYSLNLRLGWLHYLSGNYNKSQSFYAKAIALQPQSIEARLGYVYPTSTMENWNDVVKTYNEILRIAPNHSIVNYRMASICFYRKDYEKAKSFVQKVRVLYPFDFDANYLLAQIELSLGHIIEAKAALETCLQYNPTSVEAQKMWTSVK